MRFFEKAFAYTFIALALIVALMAAITSCQKDPEAHNAELEAAAKTNAAKAGYRSTPVYFDDIPTTGGTVGGYTIDTLFLKNYGQGRDCMYVVSTGIDTLSIILFNNVCLLQGDTIQAGFTQNDTFRVRMPRDWMNCYNSQSGAVWDIEAWYQ